MNNSKENKLNIHCILRDVLKELKKALVIGLAVALLSFVFAHVTYTPQYTSTTTFAVFAKGSTVGPYADTVKVEKLTSTFKAVMDSQILKKKVCQELDIPSFNGTIGVSSIEKTNLMTVSVTAGSPNEAYRLLNGLLKDYNEVGESVLGEVVLETFEEPSFPNGPNSVVQGKRQLMNGFAAGMMLTIIFIAVQSYLKNTVKNREDIEEKIDTTEIATLYHERKYRTLKDVVKRNQKKLLITDPTVGFGYSETVKKIRTNLIYQMRKKNICHST